MAQLSIMQNPWQQQQWGNFNGSNMSLNMPPPHYMPHHDGGMWNPWMQQQPYPYPYPMPNGNKIMN